jgi:hypothetical protein
MPPSSSNPSSIATAADYADAMLTARTARTVFAFALIALLLLQLILFILVHFTSKLDQHIAREPAVAPNPPASTQAAPQIPTSTRQDRCASLGRAWRALALFCQS